MSYSIQTEAVDLSTPQAELMFQSLGLDSAEIRILNGEPESLFTFDAETFSESVAGFTGNVYTTINPVTAEAAERANDRFGRYSISDYEIACYRNLPLDIDSVRPTGICATDTEHQAALDHAVFIQAKLSADFGWPLPVLSMSSGNGAYRVYRLPDLPNNRESSDLIKDVLRGLATFDTEVASVDKSCFNQSRIIRVAGSYNCKSVHTAERPNRMATILDAADPDYPVVAVTLAQLQAVAALAPPESKPERTRHTPISESDIATLPGDDFNRRADWLEDILEPHGWTFLHERRGVQFVARPGKESGDSRFKHSATIGFHKTDSGSPLFHNFSSNAEPFEPNTSYTKFHAYALLNHGGNHSDAAADLAAKGYGEGERGWSTLTDRFPGPTTTEGPSVNEAKPRPKWEEIFLPYGEFEKTIGEPRKFIINNIAKECDTLNVIAPTKLGKSFFAGQMGLCVAAGIPWLGHSTFDGQVVLIDCELHGDTIAKRLYRLSEALGIPESVVREQIRICSLRGKPKNLKQLSDTLLSVPPGTFKLVIWDTLYRLLPKGVDENANADIAQIYDTLDAITTHQRCASVVIHHSSKGNQSRKAVTDVGSGAGAQSRAVDNHIVLRPHKNVGSVVMEAALRDLPPLPKMVLRREHPLWIPYEADPNALRVSDKASFSVCEFREWLRPGVYHKSDVLDKLHSEKELGRDSAESLLKEATKLGIIEDAPKDGKFKQIRRVEGSNESKS